MTAPALRIRSMPVCPPCPNRAHAAHLAHRPCLDRPRLRVACAGWIVIDIYGRRYRQHMKVIEAV